MSVIWRASSSSSMSIKVIEREKIFFGIIGSGVDSENFLTTFFCLVSLLSQTYKKIPATEIIFESDLLIVVARAFACILVACSMNCFRCTTSLSSKSLL